MTQLVEVTPDLLEELRKALEPVFAEQRETWAKEGPAAMERFAATGATLDRFGGNCPVQAEGSVDGRSFYFRARGDGWEFWVGDSADWFTDRAFSFEASYGEWPDAGWMPQHEALGFMVDGITAYRRRPFQQRVQPWLLACFGEMIAGDREERNHRFLEEALELVQACGCTASEVLQLVDYVYMRPIGEPAQEVGGVMVTVAALCLANGLDMHADAEAELARVWTKVEAIRAKQAAKPKHSPLSGQAPRAIHDVATERARQISAEGWTPEHDDQHRNDQALPRAAACYALADASTGASGPFWITHLQTPQQVWPYRWEWKPKDRRTNLVRAAALLVAEIERIDREAQA